VAVSPATRRADEPVAGAADAAAAQLDWLTGVEYDGTDAAVAGRDVPSAVGAVAPAAVG